jgi:hypothetical protein
MCRRGKDTSNTYTARAEEARTIPTLLQHEGKRQGHFHSKRTAEEAGQKTGHYRTHTPWSHQWGSVVGAPVRPDR